MITKLSISNFKCFDHLILENLKRVTVITGASGSGKTALLEALLLAAKGNPDAIMRINKSRAVPELTALQPGVGMLPFLLQGTPNVMSPQAFNRNWSGIFYDSAKPISVINIDDTGCERSVAISMGSASAEPQLALLPALSSQPKLVTFDRRIGVNQQPPIIVSLNQSSQMTYSRSAEDLGPVAFYFPSTAQFSETDNVIWFSELKFTGKAQHVIKTIVSDFPFIENLEVLSPDGTGAVYAILNGGAVRGLSEVSSGIHKTFSLYCGLSSLTDGVLMLDEIENGIYYEKFTSLWQNLYQMAVQTKNQIFITSHSQECLMALLPLLENNADDFTLLRTERHDKGCVVKQISASAMKAALRGNIDLRGSNNAE
jgi:hypothetical protein